MTREELAQQLKDVAEMLEKGDGAIGIEQIADAINKKGHAEAVDACKDLINVLINKHMNVRHTFLDALEENSIYEESSEQFAEAAKEWAEKHGWAKIGEDVPIGTVVSAISTMQQSDMQETCRKLVGNLISQDCSVCSAFTDALKVYGYIDTDSDSFDDLAKEWAEGNDYIRPIDYSFEDLANKYEHYYVRNFVIDYVAENL